MFVSFRASFVNQYFIIFGKIMISEQPKVTSRWKLLDLSFSRLRARPWLLISNESGTLVSSVSVHSRKFPWKGSQIFLGGGMRLHSVREASLWIPELPKPLQADISKILGQQGREKWFRLQVGGCCQDSTKSFKISHNSLKMLKSWGYGSRRF